MIDPVHFREGTLADMPQIREVRYSVTENTLSFELPAQRVAAAITTRGRCWVAEYADRIVGFSMADLPDEIIWALFVLPGWSGRGIGRELLRLAMEWMWTQGLERVTLATGPGTRAEKFYEHLGWKRCGVTDHGETELGIWKRDWSASRGALKTRMHPEVG